MWLTPPADGFGFEADDEADFTGSMLLVAFPTVGRVSLLAANYLAHHLDMRSAGGVYSGRFRAAAVVRDDHPYPPARLLVAEGHCGPRTSCRAFASLVSEIALPDDAAYPLGVAILEWARTVGVRYIATIEGVSASNGDAEDRPVGGVASNGQCRRLLADAGVALRDSGVVEGLSGVLLSEGARRDMSVFCLIPAVSEGADPRAAAQTLEVIDRFLVDVEVDLAPLYEEARRMEAEARERAETPAPHMYT